MDIGMLWFDNDKQKDLMTKVERAAVYYREKYGKVPNLCFVHPSMIAVRENGKGGKSKKVMAGNVEVRSTPSVLPNHFWIGVN